MFLIIYVILLKNNFFQRKPPGPEPQNLGAVAPRKLTRGIFWKLTGDAGASSIAKYQNLFLVLVSTL